jgi:aryl-alcohol dehydrogenase-like predicted oxidoreductase
VVSQAARRRFGATDLQVFPLCLGGNVFGWTAAEQQSFEVLDAYAAAGGNFVDTADAYSSWVPGHVGGESETIIGRWMKARRNRATMIVATKVGRLSTLQGLSAATIRAGAEASLRRLDTEYIDLYFAHADDPNTPLEETLRAFDALVREGKVRYIAASNYTAPRLSDALAISRREGLAAYAGVRPHYNLVDAGITKARCVSSAAGASGLRAVFRAREQLPDGEMRFGPFHSPHAPWVAKYLDEAVSASSGRSTKSPPTRTTVAAVALAWLLADTRLPLPSRVRGRRATTILRRRCACRPTTFRG